MLHLAIFSLLPSQCPSENQGQNGGECPRPSLELYSIQLRAGVQSCTDYSVENPVYPLIKQMSAGLLLALSLNKTASVCPLKLRRSANYTVIFGDLPF